MDERERVNVTLPADLAGLVQDAVNSGQYATSGEVIREALLEWSDRRRLEGIRTRIDEAQRDIAEGRMAPADHLFDRLLAKYQKMV